MPPEYVKKGIYSTKYDVYSFGVLLLQIISGKRNDCFYGADENLNLLEYVSHQAVCLAICIFLGTIIIFMGSKTTMPGI